VCSSDLPRMVTRMGISAGWVFSTGLFCTALSGCGGGDGGDGGGSSRAGDGGTGTGGSGTGGSSAGGTGGGTSDPVLTAFCEEVRMTERGFFERCDGVGREVAEVFASIAPCAVWGPLVTAGRMRFDPTADATACIAALQARSCDDDELPAACQSVLSGVRAPGETCGFAAEETGFSECVPGSVCEAGLL